jgi:ABC-type xylose transport system permease subunit
MQKPTLLGRANAPTPKFFRKLRTIGITIGAIGTAIIATPVALPVAIVTAAGYLVTVGSVVAAVSQLTVHQEPLDAEERF